MNRVARAGIGVLILLVCAGCRLTETYTDVESRVIVDKGQVSKPEIVEAVIGGRTVRVSRFVRAAGESRVMDQRHPMVSTRWDSHDLIRFSLRSDNPSLRFRVKIIPRSAVFPECDVYRYRVDIPLEKTGWREFVLPLSEFYGNVTRLHYVVNRFDPERIDDCQLSVEQVAAIAGGYSYDMGPVTVFSPEKRFLFF